MGFSYRKLLMVCALSLGVHGFGQAAVAQDSSMAMENQMRAEADALPVPEAEKPPVPVLTASSPETSAVRSVGTKVGSYNPRAVDRIITLRDAIGVGVLTNPQTETVENNRRATDEELQQAKALYLPSVDLRADTGYQSIFSDPDGAVEGHSDLWRSQASLTLTQMLFDGMESHYENERQRHRVRSASHRVRETAEFVGLDIVESYLDVLRQRELLAIAVENLTQHRSIMGQIEDSTGAGRSTLADVEQTKARVASAVAQEAAVRQSLRNAEAKYRSLVGDMPQPDLTRPVAPRNVLEGTVDDEVKQVLTHSPTLDIKEADVNVAEAEWEQSKATLYPQIDFQAGASVGDNLDGVEGRTQQASALLVANWNLYRGGGDEARIREHVYRHAQSKTDRNATARAVESDVRQTWANMIAAGERTEAFRQQADANAMVVQAYKDQFNLDRRTLLDVLDSQNEWFVSRSNAINNGYLEMFAVYRLLALRGVLLPTMGIPYPREVNPANTSRG
ncbi:MAG: TolC family outer membrane protein [Alphaproteobacteria bacterium]|nr:TolC family outer membrane protein [Alphaproteobacteria bacterium]